MHRFLLINIVTWPVIIAALSLWIWGVAHALKHHFITRHLPQDRDLKRKDRQVFGFGMLWALPASAVMTLSHVFNWSWQLFRYDGYYILGQIVFNSQTIILSIHFLISLTLPGLVGLLYWRRSKRKSAIFCGGAIVFGCILATLASHLFTTSAVPQIIKTLGLATMTQIKGPTIIGLR